MHTITLLALLFSPSVLVTAQALGAGRLIVEAPQNAVSCQPATVDWVWTGSADDVVDNAVSIAVMPLGSYSARDTVSMRSRMNKRHHITKRDVAINIAGGSNIPMSQQQWTWNSVGITPGTYRMALTVVDASYTSYSSPFTVTTGSDTTCLGTGGQSGGLSASSSTTDLPDPTPTSAIASSSASDSLASSTSASVESSSSAATSASPVAASVFTNTSSKHESSSSNGGKIAAAVIVPLLAVCAVFLFFYVRRGKNGKGQSHGQWSEKFFGKKDDGFSSHHRNISQPANPVHAAGLAQHDDSVRNEMQELRSGAPAADTEHSSVDASMEHWVDFAGETDACPITPNRMEEIVRVSMDGPMRSQGHNLYQQGANHALRQSMTSSNDARTTSSSSAASTLPAYLRDFASPAPSFGHDANGQALQRMSQSSTETHQLSRGSVTSVATVTAQPQTNAGTRDLTRNVSNGGSIRRKPVPRISAVSPEGSSVVAITSDAQGPFADSSAISVNSSSAGSSDGELQPPAMKNHLSIQSGPTIADDQLQEILDTESEAFRTPHHSFTPADAPESVRDSPAPINSIRESNAIGLQATPAATPILGRRLPFAPVDVGQSEAGSPFLDAAQREAWKLSVRLGDDDRGFRVSFPVEHDEH